MHRLPRFLNWIRWIAFLTACALVISRLIEVPESGSLYETVLTPLHRWAAAQVTLQAVALGLFALASVLRTGIGSPWVWDTIHQVITEFRDDLFADQRDEVDAHRVTLFQYKHWCWRRPFQGPHLVAVARSHHVTQQRIAVFKASDRNREGVVGIAWARKGWVRIPEGDDPLPEIGICCNPIDKQAYAQQTGVSVDWLNKKFKQGRTRASSYAALCILSGGRPWGVLVVDSTLQIPHDTERLTAAYQPVGRILQPLLGQVSTKGG